MFVTVWAATAVLLTMGHPFMDAENCEILRQQTEQDLKIIARDPHEVRKTIMFIDGETVTIEDWVVTCESVMYPVYDSGMPT